MRINKNLASKTISECTTQAAARAAAKGLGMTQAAAVEEYRRIASLREDREEAKAYNISIGGFRSRAARIVAKRIFDLIWQPANIGNINVIIGECLHVTYKNHIDGKYSSRCQFLKRVWDIDITLPERFMKNFRVVDWDGVPAIITRSRGILHKATTFRMSKGSTFSTDNCWIAAGEGMYYHAETAKKALAGLARKTKRQAIKTAITPETLITRSLYRELTGACQLGVQDFCKRHGLENVKHIKAGKLLEILRPGTFGRDTLASLIVNAEANPS